MSVIVNGMKMPNSCTMCWLNTSCGVWNVEPVKHKGFNERLEDCPLTELIQCKDCKHWMTEDGTFPDFDGKKWHRCKKLRTFIDEDGDTPMTREWHYCGMAERKEE